MSYEHHHIRLANRAFYKSLIGCLLILLLPVLLLAVVLIFYMRFF